MFKLTAKLKEYAVKNLGVKADATDAEYLKAINTALASGKIKYKEFVAMGAVAPVVAPAVRPVVQRRSAVKTFVRPQQVQRPVARPAAVPSAILDRMVTEKVNRAMNSNIQRTSTFAPEGLLSKSPAGKIRVKAATEQYTNTRKGAFYPDRSGYNQQGSKNKFAGMAARIGDRQLEHPGDLDKAVIAAYYKWILAPQFAQHGIVPPEKYKLREHEMDLVKYALHELPWTGTFKGQEGNGIERKKLDDLQLKTILNDATSGGAEISPYMFDDAIVLFPVLYGELFPHVNVVNTDRASIKSGKMNNPTITSGTAEGTAITPLTTTSFISAFDTTIWPAVGAVEIGLDFEEDSPVDVGGQLVERYGLVALQYLDRVIAYGNGTNEPLGLYQTVGAITANSDNGAAGPMTISDLSQLMYGLGKEYRTEPKAFQAYVMSDLMYRNIRDIQVGPMDERRPLGIDYQNYEVLGVPCKVQNNIPAGRIAFANLNRYRLYRRLGLQVRIETAGRTLALSNTKIIVVRQRFGGQMETGNAICLMTDGQV